MKDAMLLIMTPNMSLEKWDANGQLTRELSLYKRLCAAANLKLIIFSYGRYDSGYCKGFQDITVLTMPTWIPSRWPFRLQNIIYHTVSPWLHRHTFARVRFVKTNQFDAAWLGLIIKLVHRIPLVIRMGYYHSHFKPVSRWRKLSERISFKLCDKIIVTSTQASAFIINKYRLQAEKVLCIPNGIDTELFKPIAIHHKYDIIFVGRLEPTKNIELLLNIIKSTKLKALIIGSGSLESQIKTFVEKDKLTWRPRIANNKLPLAYNQARIFVLLSKYEGNPKSLLEAMACGLPCIGTNVHGIRDCIINHHNGVLVEENSEDIATAITEILTNPKAAKHMGVRAREMVIANCDQQKNLARELTLYQDLLPSEVI
ncbi:glycosyltransferase family 4 protein [Mucilaginibacter panaciglaebae]|uniref:Glycosyltransferase involved in cell wall biosynthesis n=1 Tax=Mucilaginibacter panaciglaebae TaxID=502331 RepID=A0ABP7WE33_9SPHI